MIWYSMVSMCPAGHDLRRIFRTQTGYGMLQHNVKHMSCPPQLRVSAVRTEQAANDTTSECAPSTSGPNQT